MEVIDVKNKNLSVILFIIVVLIIGFLYSYFSEDDEIEFLVKNLTDENFKSITIEYSENKSDDYKDISKGEFIHGEFRSYVSSNANISDKKNIKIICYRENGEIIEKKITYHQGITYGSNELEGYICIEIIKDNDEIVFNSYDNIASDIDIDFDD
jgi:hypothetical protein